MQEPDFQGPKQEKRAMGGARDLLWLAEWSRLVTPVLINLRKAARAQGMSSATALGLLLLLQNHRMS